MKNKNTGTSKKLQSPLYSVRRNVPRPRLSFDGTALHGTGYTRVITTVAFSASGAYSLDFSTQDNVNLATFSSSVGLDLNLFAARFQEFRFLDLQMHWVPRVAPGVADGGTAVSIAYIDNPEMMVARLGGPSAVNVPAIKGIRNVKTFNAWQNFTYNVPVTRRLPWFNINNLTNYADENVVERSIQGLVVAGFESINAAALLGQFHMTFTVEFRGLTTTLTS